MDIRLVLNAGKDNDRLFTVLRRNGYKPIRIAEGFTLSITLEDMPVLYILLSDNNFS